MFFSQIYKLGFFLTWLIVYLKSAQMYPLETFPVCNHVYFLKPVRNPIKTLKQEQLTSRINTATAFN